MDAVISFICSKLGTILALAGGFLVMWLRNKYLRGKVERAEAQAQAAQQEAEVLKGDNRIKEEVSHEKQEALGRIDAGGDFEPEFYRLRRRQSN